jgi:hypothetical protein
MLLMTCSLGGVLRIGDGLQVTVQARQRDRVAVSVVAPPGSHLVFDGVALNPLRLPSGCEAYYFSLRQVRQFRIGDIQIMVWLPGEEIPQAADYDDCVHVGIATPHTLQVSYEYAGRAGAGDRTIARQLWH